MIKKLITLFILWLLWYSVWYHKPQDDIIIGIDKDGRPVICGWLAVITIIIVFNIIPTVIGIVIGRNINTDYGKELD